MKITRREFVKTVVASGTAFSGTLFGSGMLAASPSLSPSIVVKARSAQLKRRGNELSQEHTAAYLNRALLELTGKADARAAWKSLFSPREKVGIKLSCLPGKPLSSSRGLVMAVIDGLLSAGLEAKNIYAWERTGRELKRAGFEVGNWLINPARINIVGTDSFSRGGYSDSIEFAGSVGTCFSLIMETVDALINMPVLKDHDIAGVSIGMKNFYGAIYNPNKFHANNCDPYVADLNSHPLIKDRLRLVVCDASRIQVHNGPAFYARYALEYGAILVSRDPVALDWTGWQIVEQARKRMKLKTLAQEGREPRYIASAARLKLGQADPKRIKIIDI